MLKTRHFTGVVKLNHHNNPRGVFIIFVTTVRRMRLREMKGSLGSTQEVRALLVFHTFCKP